MRMRVVLTIAAIACTVAGVGAFSARNTLSKQERNASSLPRLTTLAIPAELAFLKPNVTKTESKFFRMDKGTKSEYFVGDYTLTLDKMDRGAVMRELVSRFPEKDGWRFGGCSMTSYMMKNYGTTPPHGVYMVDVFEAGDGKSPPGKMMIYTYVSISECLSPAQVALVRLQHLGKDPFKSP